MGSDERASGRDDAARHDAAFPDSARHDADEPTVQLPVTGADAPDAAVADDTPPRSRKGLLVGLCTLGVLLIAVVAAYLIDLGTTSGEIERGTTIAGVEVGGMTPAQATAALDEQVRPRFAEPATVSAHGEKITFDPATAGLTPDIAEAIAAAGTRSASPVARIGSFFRSASVPLHVEVDRAMLTDWVDDVAARTDVAKREGAVDLEGTELAVVRPVTGRALDVDAAVDAMATAWADGGPAALAGLELPTSSQDVRATGAGVDAAVAQAKAILSGPVAVDAGGTELTIPATAIAEVLTIEPDDAQGWTVTVDVDALRSPLTAEIEKTEREPKEATIGLVDGAPAIGESVTGRIVAWDASKEALAAALEKPAGRSWKVEYVTAEPEFSTADARALGIDEEIGKFETSGFVYESGQNIKTLAEKVNGVIVQPGATFSINEFTGPRGVEQGYIEAGIIQDGAAGKAVGGGISQFATTLYNATYFAGLQDVTHTPHSYYISRYPEGREATIFDGVIDLAFTNNYPTAILIQTIWTENDITVRIWGTKTVEVESVTGDRYDFTDAPSKTIPFGQECSPSDGSQGFSVDNTRIIRDLAGEETDRQTSSTQYNGQFRVICEPAPPAPPAPTTPAPDAPPSSEAPSSEAPPSVPSSSVPPPSAAPAPGGADAPPTEPPTEN